MQIFFNKYACSTAQSVVGRIRGCGYGGPTVKLHVGFSTGRVTAPNPLVVQGSTVYVFLNGYVILISPLV